MKNKVIYPGTFDPMTNGHINIIERASCLFDDVVVAVASNASKQPLFSIEQRVDLSTQALTHLPNVSVEGFSCLLIDFAAGINANVIIRGLRAVSDFEYEFQLAAMNRKLNGNIETLFLTPPEQNTFVSSTLVREIAHFSGDVSAFVPPHIHQALRAHFDKEKK